MKVLHSIFHSYSTRLLAMNTPFPLERALLPGLIFKENLFGIKCIMAGAKGSVRAWRAQCVQVRDFDPNVAEQEDDLSPLVASISHLVEEHKHEKVVVQSAFCQLCPMD